MFAAARSPLSVRRQDEFRLGPCGRRAGLQRGEGLRDLASGSDQIPACAANAPGSSLGFWRRARLKAGSEVPFGLRSAAQLAHQRQRTIHAGGHPGLALGAPLDDSGLGEVEISFEHANSWRAVLESTPSLASRTAVHRKMSPFCLVPYRTARNPHGMGTS